MRSCVKINGEKDKIIIKLKDEATQEEWDEYCNQSLRGENGFGSSDKK